MAVKTLEGNLWNDAQAYSLATVCLLLGITAGYLLRMPSRAAVVDHGVPQALPAPAASGENFTPAQMKRMADKKAEPLLAQLQKHPDDVALLTKIGQTYFYGRQFSTSAEYYERAARVKPDAEILTSLGAIYHHAGDDNKAIDSLNRALEIDPNFDGALFNLGMLKWQSQSDPEAAISAWGKLLKAHPKHPKRANVEALITQAKAQMNMASARKDHTLSKQLKKSN
jgi:cytochrome c-type biogenesis protein CcmH/NrfG